MSDEKPKRDEKAGPEDWTWSEPIQYSPPDELYSVRAPDEINFDGIAHVSAVPITGGTFAGFGMRGSTPEEACESYVDDALYNLESAVDELPDGPAKAHLCAVLELLEEWTEMLK